jgi:hypothetical protein
VHPDQWKDRLVRVQAMGLNTVEVPPRPPPAVLNLCALNI